ncbi:hypothetical protein AAOE16_02980 [Ekhidna sp. MALMAid0563]|uniref:hypothetical protein n=1 Tax=Ekhidna sp. MALMAid0563 TaxID=3143937 RepID=UPI0032DFA512
MKPLSINYLLFIVFGCASVDKLRQSEKLISVDGSNEDWPHLVHFEKEAGMLYGVTHDQENLYVLARFYEDDAKRRVISSGLTVWIDPDGKKNREIGVSYPVIGSQPKRERNRDVQNSRKEKELDDNQLENIMIQGVFSDDMQITQKSHLVIDLDVMIGFDSTRNLLYELKMPLALLKQKAKKDIGKIAIGFELSGPTRPINVISPVSGGGAGRGRGGMRPGGGRRGSGPSGTQRVTPNQTISFWYQVEL